MAVFEVDVPTSFDRATMSSLASIADASFLQFPFGEDNMRLKNIKVVARSENESSREKRSMSRQYRSINRCVVNFCRS